MINGFQAFQYACIIYGLVSSSYEITIILLPYLGFRSAQAITLPKELIWEKAKPHLSVKFISRSLYEDFKRFLLNHTFQDCLKLACRGRYLNFGS